jgi:hypothetical protein
MASPPKFKIFPGMPCGPKYFFLPMADNLFHCWKFVIKKNYDKPLSTILRGFKRACTQFYNQQITNNAVLQV